MARQERFSRLWQGYETNKGAMLARNKRFKELKAKGCRVTKWTLPNQLRKHCGSDEPENQTCSVYGITIE